MKKNLYLKDQELKQYIEKIFIGYRETVSDAKKILDKYSIGVAHNKVIHLISLYEGITISELLKKTIEKAEEISSKAPIAVRQAKQSIHKGLQMSLSDGLSFEIEAYNRTIPTEDRREGVLAFNEKRKPVFKGK